MAPLRCFSKDAMSSNLSSLPVKVRNPFARPSSTPSIFQESYIFVIPTASLFVPDSFIPQIFATGPLSSLTSHSRKGGGNPQSPSARSIVEQRRYMQKPLTYRWPSALRPWIQNQSVPLVRPFLRHSGIDMMQNLIEWLRVLQSCTGI